MAGIFAHIEDDIAKLRQLKAEINDVKSALKNINIQVDIDIKSEVEARLKTLTDAYNTLAQTIAEKEGAIVASMKNISDATSRVVSGNSAVTSGGSSPDNTADYAKIKDVVDSVVDARDELIAKMIIEQRAIEDTNARIKELNNLRKSESGLTNEQEQELITLNHQLIQHKQALSGVRTSLNAEIKLEGVAQGSMKELNHSLGLMRARYRELSEEERNSEFGKNLLKNIQETDRKIKELDASIGNFQRNVGNYPGNGLLATNDVRSLVANLKTLQASYASLSSEGKASEEGRGMLSTITALKSKIDDLTPSIKTATGALLAFAGVDMVKNLVGKVVQVRAQFQEMETSISTLVGESKQKELMAQIKELAKVSPLTMGGIVRAEKMMLGFNIEADKTIQYLRALSDVSMGNSQKFNSLTLAFSQMSAAGKLMGQDLNQMINAGFNPLQQISERTGKSIALLKEEMSKGAISAEMVQQAFIDATSEGGKFFNMSQNASQTITGQISMLEDAIDTMYNNLGQSAEGVISGVIGTATTLVENYETIGKVLMELIATYGTYRAALFTYIALTRGIAVAERTSLVVKKAMTIATYAQVVAQKALNAAVKANPYVMLATVIVGVVTALWAFSDSTSAAKKAQSELNKKIEDAIEKEKERKQSIEDLISVATDENETTVARKRALEDLKQLMPSVFAQYNTEIELTNAKVQAQKDLNDELEKEKRLREKKTVDDVGKRAAELKRILDTYEKIRIDRRTGDHANLLNEVAQSMGWANYEEYFRAGGNRLANIRLEYNALISKKKELESALRKSVNEDFDFSVSTKNVEDLQKIIDDYDKIINNAMPNTMSIDDKDAANDWKNKFVTVADELVDIPITELERRQQVMRERIKSINDNAGKDYVKDAKEAWDVAKKEVQKIYSNRGNRSLYPDAAAYDKAMEEAKTKEDAAKKAYQKLLPDKDADKNADKNAQKEAEAEDKYNRIVAENNRKRLKQIRDNKIAQQQLEIDLMEDAWDKRSAQIDLDYQKEMNDILDWEDELKRQKIEAKRKEFEADPKNKDKTFNELSVDTSLTADEQAIKTKKELVAAMKWSNAVDLFNKDEKQAQTKLIADYLTYEQARTKVAEEYAEKRKELYEADGKTFKEGITPGNVDELKRQENEALKAVDENFAMRSEEFQAWADATANMALWQLEELLEKANSALSSNNTTTDVSKASAAVNVLQSAIKKRKAENKYSPDKQSVKDWKELQEVLNDTAGSFKELGDEIGGTAGELLSAVGSIASSVLSMINGIVMLTNTSTAAITGVSKAASSAIKMVEKASLVLTVVSAALSVATAIAGLFNSDKAKQKHIEELQDRIDTLQWELDHAGIQQLKEKQIDILTRVEQAYADVWQQIWNVALATKNWMYLWKVASDGMLSDLPQITKAVAQLADYFANIDYTANKALGEEKYKGTRKQLEALTKQQLLIQEQIESEKGKKDPDDSKIQEWQQKIQELGEEAVEVINEITESIIGGTSTEITNELAEAFFDAFAAGEDAAKAWGDKAEEIVAKIVRSMLVTKFLEEPLGELFDKYKSKWFKDGEFVGINAVINSMSEFSNDLMSIGSTFADIFENLPPEVKDMLNKVTDTEQEATREGTASLTQEQGEKLDGRFTALQLAGERITNENAIQTEKIALLYVTVGELKLLAEKRNNTLDGIVDQIALIYLELQDINENTGESAKALKAIQADIAEVKNNTAKL